MKNIERQQKTAHEARSTSWTDFNLKFTLLHRQQTIRAFGSVYFFLFWIEININRALIVVIEWRTFNLTCFRVPPPKRDKISIQSPDSPNSFLLLNKLNFPLHSILIRRTIN